MRKVFWCCAAAGAAVCCAFGAAAYVSQNPDSTLGRCALAACPLASHAVRPAAGRPGLPATADTDDLVPADPVPVDDPPPLLPTPGAPIPAEVAALMTPPPIVIHDEEDLNPQPNPLRPEFSTVAHVDAEAVRPSTVDIGDLARRLDDDPEPRRFAGPPVMPYCAEDDGATPHMPYCTEDGSAPDGNQEDGRKVNAAPYRDFDACAFWMGFFSGPSRMLGDPGCGRCEEDAHYPQQYSGVPYTGQPSAPAAQPPATNLKPLPALPEPASLPGNEEQSEPPAPKEKHAEPSELFSHSRHLQTPRPSEPQSDTMEMRPSDWKPYSLDPGPF